MKDELLVHNFDLWLDPQSDPVVEFFSDELFYYFRCWDEEQKHTNFLGLFKCNNVQCIKYSKTFDHFPYIEEHDFKCYHYEIENSTWVDQWTSLKNKKEPNWRKYDQSTYNHFILMTAESYIEVICGSISLEKVKSKKNKIKLWKNI